jgi:hypothetical protein
MPADVDVDVSCIVVHVIIMTIACSMVAWPKREEPTITCNIIQHAA